MATQVVSRIPPNAIVNPVPIPDEDSSTLPAVENHTSLHQRSRGKHDDSMLLCLGALYPCPETVQAILAPAPGPRKRILDIGCGTGTWCLDMAEMFPDADILGIDRHVNGFATLLDNVPSNCRFETRFDYEFLSEEEFVDCYDVIHMRYVAGGCTQFVNTMDNIQACLRPGGLFILVDSTGEVLTEDGNTVFRPKSRGRPEGSRLRRLFYEVSNANVDQGFDENMLLATMNDGFWESTELVDCKAAELLVPIGPWITSSDKEEEQRLQQAGRVMQQLLQAVLPGHEMVLKDAGFDNRIMHDWHEEILAELQDSSVKKYLDVRLLWGRRKGGLPLANVTPSATHRHPCLRIYDDAESWKQMLEGRRLLGQGGPDYLEAFVHKIRQSPTSPTRHHYHHNNNRSSRNRGLI